ncbi:hypothetical protein BU14_0290s0005 [Porphyra umbilicalis]|uniref:Glutathione peroxidase n=1 Tax=Porphyra umbilicalis TaxID=2786 RepID=A0A1X6P0P2_PORUM|nr:hypothetical protein BU14_0290s0005 [Porphyra umbilicalis]|eukprot:OSX74397.1 hypothetical protein BU14_0290s0005 [Porphyra umbilicalis]
MRCRPAPPLPVRTAPTARFRRGLPPSPELYPTAWEVPPLRNIHWGLLDMATLRGKVLWVINVASEDDESDAKYAHMVQMHDTYGKAGLEILAFPCNWYGQKEPGDNEDIAANVKAKYGVRFHMMSKGDIEENPLFGMGLDAFPLPPDVVWNFHGSFLFSREGICVARFGLTEGEEAVEAAIKELVEREEGAGSPLLTPKKAKSTEAAEPELPAVVIETVEEEDMTRAEDDWGPEEEE